jgi:two-component system, OmpR family, response regulator QseB
MIGQNRAMKRPARPALLLVEDDEILGQITAELLAPDYEVTIARTGQAGLHLAFTQQWDVMVIDRGLPVMDGTALVRAIRAKGIATPILILTALAATSDKVDGLDAGANDYLTKPFDAAELAARLRALTRDYRPAASAVVVVGDWQLDPTARSLRSVYGPLANLTAKETALLTVLASHPADVFTREELLAIVFDPTDAPGLIDTYVHQLRRKSTRGLIRTVHGVGYQIGDGHD